MNLREVSELGKTPNISIQTYLVSYPRNRIPIKSPSPNSSPIMYTLLSIKDYSSALNQKAQDAKILVKLINKINKSKYSNHPRLQGLPQRVATQRYPALKDRTHPEGKKSWKSSRTQPKNHPFQGKQKGTPAQTKAHLQFQESIRS